MRACARVGERRSESRGAAERLCKWGWTLPPPSSPPPTRAPCPPPPLHQCTQVASLPDLAPWCLYLVDWGYNTPEERARAAAHPRIEVVGVERFRALAGV